ncbi:MAG: FAD-dependent oxidoreductase [Anaerolineales bacterium]
MANSSIVIVGAGIFGASAALELTKRGHDVILLDPGPIPHVLASSTDVSKVLRMDYGADEFYMELMEEAFTGWEAWNKGWGIPLYHQTGMLMLSGGSMKAGEFEHDSLQLLRQRGHQPQHLPSEQLAKQFPGWNTQVYPEGYLNPEGGWAESGEVVARLISQGKTLGVDVQGGTAFASLMEEGSNVVGVRTAGGEELKTEHVIIAAGSWTPSLLPHMEEYMWAVGQPVVHFLVEEVAAYQPPNFVTWAADIHNTGWYGFPALDDGTLKVANHGPGKRQPAEAPREVDEDTEKKFRAFFRNSLPGLADAPMISNRLCMYCDTWDGDFWIDHDPDRPGLVVATGGSGHGFKFAPMLGPIIADVVEGKSNRFSYRFRWRTRGEIKTEHARYS